MSRKKRARRGYFRPIVIELRVNEGCAIYAIKKGGGSGLSEGNKYIYINSGEGWLDGSAIMKEI